MLSVIISLIPFIMMIAVSAGGFFFTQYFKKAIELDELMNHHLSNKI